MVLLRFPKSRKSMDRLPTSLQSEVKIKRSPVWSPFCLLGKYFLNLTTNCGRTIDEQTDKRLFFPFHKVNARERGLKVRAPTFG